MGQRTSKIKEESLATGKPPDFDELADAVIQDAREEVIADREEHEAMKHFQRGNPDGHSNLAVLSATTDQLSDSSSFNQHSKKKSPQWRKKDHRRNRLSMPPTAMEIMRHKIEHEVEEDEEEKKRLRHLRGSEVSLIFTEEVFPIAVTSQSPNPQQADAIAKVSCDCAVTATRFVCQWQRYRRHKLARHQGLPLPNWPLMREKGCGARASILLIVMLMEVTAEAVQSLLTGAAVIAGITQKGITIIIGIIIIIGTINNEDRLFKPHNLLFRQKRTPNVSGSTHKQQRILCPIRRRQR